MKAYLTKQYTYRNFQNLMGGMIATLFGTILLIAFVFLSVSNTNWENFRLSFIPQLIMGFGIPSILIFAGLWILNSWRIKRVMELVISDSGIKYGTKECAWDQIKWISCYYSKNKTLTLFFQKKGFLSIDHNLILTEPLSEAEIENLFDAIEKDITPLHKQLQVG